MIILDTNVISALMHLVPEPIVVKWFDQQPRTSLWTTSVNVFELRHGLQLLQPGKRRSFLEGAFEVILQKINRRIISFDDAAAQQAGELAALRESKGRPVEIRDTMIAGIVLVNHATLATRNTAHFEDISVEVINPWMV